MECVYVWRRGEGVEEDADRMHVYVNKLRRKKERNSIGKWVRRNMAEFSTSERGQRKVSKTPAKIIINTIQRDIDSQSDFFFVFCFSTSATIFLGRLIISKVDPTVLIIVCASRTT